jgi:thiamine biosynthesis lipoprotein
MKDTRVLMGMPITVELVDAAADPGHAQQVFDYLQYVDNKFSTYKSDSEISALNRRELSLAQASPDMQLVFALAEQTRRVTDGYFDIQRGDQCDPSGLVKGWAIYRAAEILWLAGLKDFYVEAGGDIQTSGHNAQGEPWRVGIRHPFDPAAIVKIVAVGEAGVATSGTYVRGQHIYRPGDDRPLETGIVSLTVIGPDIYEADRFATAAFAMGVAGIEFIDRLEGFEGYMIDAHGQATLTTGFGQYVVPA